MALGVTEAKAADAKKTPPLVNLAEEKDVKIKVGDGMTIKEEELLTDGDKYYLQHNDTANKDGTSWEAYQERGTEVTSTNAKDKGVWVQIDLGASYPIEVINLKRQVYEGTSTIGNGNPSGQGTRLNGKKISYEDTAIVIGNEENLSDGEVVYYAGDPALPSGVEKPDSISEAYQEEMGGQWFYMDYENEKGLGATELGTTKTARYVRVYTENPKEAAVKFMELGVYGYENAQSVQKQDGPRRVIDNENPMMIATAYSNDVYKIGQKEGPELQGWNTVAGRWKAIPDDLKKNNVLLLHTNNLRQFAPDHIGQAYLQAFHEHGLQIAYEERSTGNVTWFDGSGNSGTRWNAIQYHSRYGLRMVGFDVPHYPICRGYLIQRISGFLAEFRELLKEVREMLKLQHVLVDFLCGQIRIMVTQLRILLAIRI